MMGVVAGLLGLLLGALPYSAHALALGKLKVHSALNEPLNAEIDFTSVTDKELKGLKAQLASRADFEQAGVERLPFLSQIKFVVSKRLDGRYFLQLSTDEQIEEPFLHFILQLDWPGGKLLHEYTALIDPPYQVAGQPAAIEVPRTEPALPPVEEKAAAAPSEPAPEAPPQAAAAEPMRLPETAAPAAEPPQAAPAAPSEPELLGPQEVQKSGVTISPETGWPVERPAGAATVESLPSARTGEAGGAAVPTTVPAWANMADYQVRQGDTAWGIAERIRGDSKIATEQIVLALYRANRGAFFRNNVNNLYAGKVLKIPDREEVESLGVAAARKEFRAQYDVWQEYKLKLASTSSEIKVAPEAAAPASTESPAAPAAKPAAKAPAGDVAPATKGAQPEELLKIVRSNVETQKGTDKAGAEAEAGKDTSGKERQALADRVATLEESLVSKQMEQRDMSEKVGQVRDLLKKEAKLLEVESKPLAEAQPAKPAPAAPPKTETAKVAPTAPAASEVKPEEPKPAAKEPPAPAPVAKTEKPAPAKKRPVVPPPPPEKGMVAELMDSFGDLIMPAVIGLLVIVGGAIGFVYMRRRRKSIAEFEESILASEGMTALEGTTTTDTAGVQAAPSGDTSFLSDFSQGGMGTVHTDEVDPIAEAEVYLAYGRDETAEEILKDAIVKNPKREELKVKLLEIYHQRNDVGAFETLAEEYYAQLGGRPGNLWSKVEEMGRKLNPNNPMFRGGGAAATAGAAASAFASTLSDAQPIGARANVVEEPATQPPTGLDFDMGGEPPNAAAPETTAFDFDLGSPAPEAGATSIEFEAAQPGAAAPAPEAPSLESMDLGQPADTGIAFDLGGPEASEEERAPETPAAESAGASSEETSLNWDFEAGGATAEEAAAPTAEPAGASWDETATKLDLAKAYIDMGDSEGARSILNEVMSEGNAEQKQQARDLAAQIG